MSALKEAFQKAGVKSPTEALSDIALKAMVAHADDTDATIEAIWRDVQKDRSLLIALFALDYQRSISGLLYRVRSDIGYKQSTNSLNRPIERKGAKVVSILRDRDAKAERERRDAERAHQDKLDQEYQNYLASWRKTQIGALEINGTPVWQLSPGTVRGWLVTQKRRWRTVELLIEGLPDDGRPIEYYRKPEEVEKLWRVAINEEGAAQ